MSTCIQQVFLIILWTSPLRYFHWQNKAAKSSELQAIIPLPRLALCYGKIVKIITKLIQITYLLVPYWKYNDESNTPYHCWSPTALPTGP